MIRFPINTKKENTNTFRVYGNQTIGNRKIETLFLCYAENENVAKKIKHDFPKYSGIIIVDPHSFC
jgi:hypothetical protein